jgi:hypothetical protein
LRERKKLRHEKSLHKQIHWKNNDVKKSGKGGIMFVLEKYCYFVWLLGYIGESVFCLFHSFCLTEW